MIKPEVVNALKELGIHGVDQGVSIKRYRDPDLSHLLDKIKKQGYAWELESSIDFRGVNRCSIFGIKAIQGRKYWADSPEEAAAQALIWILQNAKGE